MNRKEKVFAKESDKTIKAREKLKKQLKDIEKQVTQEALKRKVEEIHHWIARHAHVRVVLRTKKICLFDENQNAAQVSKCVDIISSKLKQNLQIFPQSSKLDLKTKIDSPKEK
jgi:hypothetical protein